jgi:serine/threonine-protein kinase
LKLTDFGLSVPNKAPFTDPGNRTGTPNYMAPELVRRRPTNERVDIFAFGVTMYELCTRELPWPRGTNGLAAMTHDTPPEPIQTYRPAIDPRLADAIHWCLVADPKERRRLDGSVLEEDRKGRIRRQTPLIGARVPIPPPQERRPSPEAF